MTKTDLIKQTSDQTGFTRADVTNVIDTALEIIKAGIQTGDRINLHGFGIFTMATRAGGTRKNPRTGDPVEVPAKKVVKFRPAKVLKEAVAG